MDSSLFQFIHTKKEALLFLEKLNQIANSLFQIKTDLETVLNQLLSIDEKKLLLFFCQNQKIDMHDPVQFQRLVSSLKDEINQIPTLSLQLAISPSSDLLEKISKWLTVNLNRKYFLDIKVDQSLVAGSVVTANGSFKDYTLKKIIEEEYSKQQLIAAELN